MRTDITGKKYLSTYPILNRDAENGIISTKEKADNNAIMQNEFADLKILRKKSTDLIKHFFKDFLKESIHFSFLNKKHNNNIINAPSIINPRAKITS